MAAPSAHPTFPSRPYTSGLGRAGASTQPQNNFVPPQQTAFGGAPQTSYAAPQGGFGGAAGATTQQQREAQRLERERQERAERERREAEERGVLDALSEEQREEINEAVSFARADPR